MHEIVKPCAVRKGRCINRRIIFHNIIDIDKIGVGHSVQIGIAQHHALGLAGGARGVEQPGQIIGMTGNGGGQCFAVRLECGLCFDVMQRAFGRDQSRQVARARDKHHPAQGILNNISRLAGMKLGIDGDSDRAAEPDAIEKFEIGRAVLHEDGNTVTHLHIVVRTQRGADARRATCELGISCDQILSRRESRRTGLSPGRADEPFRQVHRRLSTVCLVFNECRPPDWI
jgi:hypothetical protein